MRVCLRARVRMFVGVSSFAPTIFFFFLRTPRLPLSPFCMIQSVIQPKSLGRLSRRGPHAFFAALGVARLSPFPPLPSLQCQFNPCFPGVKCVNTAPGYRCEACPLGFTGTPVEGVGVLFAQTNKQVSGAVERGRLDAFTVLETSPSGSTKSGDSALACH